MSPVSPELDEKRMSFLEHLAELRTRLIRALQIYAVAFCLCWWKVELLFGRVVRPLEIAWRTAGLPDKPEIHGALAEPFVVYMRVAMYAALFVASPGIFYQLWAFVAPGLYRNERRMTMTFVVSATALFLLGGAFAYFVALPMAFRFFFTMHTIIPGTGMRIAPMQMASGYFDFVLQTLVIFGVVFELPLVLLGLGLLGLVDWKQLWSFGRYFILVAFTVGAILSPPDVVSQTLVSVPLCVLYLFSILLVAMFGTKKPTPAAPVGAQAERRKSPTSQTRVPPSAERQSKKETQHP